MKLFLTIPFLLLTAAAPASETPLNSERKANRITATRGVTEYEQDAHRIQTAKGVTLQWIDWNTRGSVYVQRGPVWFLRASQAEAGGPGRLFVSGRIVSISPDSFILRGTIRITDTPDRGRHCEATKDWHFAVTQNRPYYRLREFEWCDHLTDYIDIYF